MPDCATCGHRWADHGDRAIGICSATYHPNLCLCTGYKPAADEPTGVPV